MSLTKFFISIFLYYSEITKINITAIEKNHNKSMACRKCYILE